MCVWYIVYSYIYWNQWGINRNATYGNLAITRLALIGSTSKGECAGHQKRRLLQNLSLPLSLPLFICKYSSVSIEYWVLGTRQSSRPSPSPTLLLVVISKIACINALNVNEWVTSRGELLLMMLRHLQQLFGFPFNPPSRLLLPSCSWQSEVLSCTLPVLSRRGAEICPRPSSSSSHFPATIRCKLWPAAA